MVDCSYCGKSFGGEKEYIRHLKQEHQGELKSIDRKRIEEFEEDKLLNFSGSIGVFALGGILVLSFVFILFLYFNPLGSNTTNTGGSLVLDSDHYHGTIDVVIDGNRIDFSQPKYQLQSDYFHFESGNGERWHAHARNVPLNFAMQTVDINIHNNTALTFNGNTYTEKNYNISITSNGESIDPTSYILKQGDNIQITVE